MESNRTQAEAWGYLLHRNLDPTRAPVFTADGWLLFDNEGGIAPGYPAAMTDALERQLAGDIARGVAVRTRASLPEGVTP
jgi:hypothetical protein